jgi:hypothetical protein
MYCSIAGVVSSILVPLARCPFKFSLTVTGGSRMQRCVNSQGAEDFAEGLWVIHAIADQY